MQRQLAKSLLVAGVLSLSSQINALGLGGIKVYSALNQPLRVEIEVIDLNLSQISDLKPSILLPQRQQNGETSDRVTARQFLVEVSDDRLVVTSSKPISDPFINLLVQLDWSAGRLQREYTVLLDPPVFQQDKLVPAVTVYAPSSQASSADVISKSGSADAKSNSDDETYQVKTADTLWQIARQYRPDKTVTVQQMMIALQQKNPSAFIARNINRLRKGELLRIPTMAEIQKISPELAFQKVKQQNRWLLAQQQQPVAAAPMQLDYSDKTDPNNNQTSGTSPSQSSETTSVKPQSKTDMESVGAVRLITTEDSKNVNSEGSGDPKSKQQQRINALTNELSLSNENLDRNQRENKELVAHLALLEEQMETLQRLLELKDNQLALLQSQQQRQQSPTASTQPNSSESASSENNLLDVSPNGDLVKVEPTDSAADINEESMSEAGNTVAEETTEAVTPENPLAADATIKQKPSLLDQLLQQIKQYQLFLIGLWFIGLTFFMAWLKRRQQQKVLDITEQNTDTAAIDESADVTDSTADERMTVTVASQSEIQSHQWSEDGSSGFTPTKREEEQLEELSLVNNSALDATAIDDSSQQPIRAASASDNKQGEIIEDSSSALKIIAEADDLIKKGYVAAAIERLNQSLQFHQGNVLLIVKLLEAAVEARDFDLFYRAKNSLPDTIDEGVKLALLRLTAQVEGQDNAIADVSVEDALDYSSETTAVGSSSSASISEPPTAPKLDLASDSSLSTDQYDHLIDRGAVRHKKTDSQPTKDNSQMDPPVLDDFINEAVQPSIAPGSTRSNELDPDIAAMFAEMNLEDLAADDEFDFLASTDECSTKLDLARAFIDMDDIEGAKTLLQEVIEEGDSEQQKHAKDLMNQLS